MGCCSQASDANSGPIAPRIGSVGTEEVLLASRAVGDGLRRTHLSVPGIHCGACMRTIENALGAIPGVEHARVNLSTRRVAVRWRGDTPPPLIETLTDLGYEAHLHDVVSQDNDRVLPELLRALAVAGFAAMNIMLLSVSVWAGADADTRDLFHWISAAIALPALVYSGRIFFRSAWGALRHGRTNMDVPISIGVTLAFGLSLYETATGGEQAYFDASITLLFFLLIGRTLDHMMRERARNAVKGLASLSARGANIIRPDGSMAYLPVEDIRPGMEVLLAAGERVPVDGLVVHGMSHLDCSIVSGESAPLPAGAGSEVRAGTLNLTAPLRVRATAAADSSFLAQMVRLMEVAEGGRARYRRIADRAAELYSPVVHLAAIATFLAWMAIDGDWHKAISIAIAVLIITCPCALGLAVPIVQVVAARRLFENGILVKDGSAMERLAEIDMVVFDKTGTLTQGSPRLTNPDEIGPAELRLAATIATHSRHPLSGALSALSPVGGGSPLFDEVAEIPGFGIEAVKDGATYRLGREDWALGLEPAPEGAATVLATQGRILARFTFEDRLRDGAAETVAELKRSGLRIELLSGDREAAVAGVAREFGLEEYRAGVLPDGKLDRIAALAEEGRAVLMVGDGLNDAPALAAAHVSIAPATAADVGRSAADFVFLRDSLAAVPLAIRTARNSARLIRQNLILAVAYNAVAVPVAVLGHVTPLIAALAMSGSSLIVVANAFRLDTGPAAGRTGRTAAPRRSSMAAEPAA